jgi:hypothetical protein
VNEIKSILEDLTGRKRFSGRAMYERANPILLTHKPRLVASMREKLGESNYRYIINGLLRNVFLIELVNDDISSTKMEVRWTLKESRGKKQENFDQSDPRFCEFEGCLKILLELLKELQASIEDTQITRLLELFQRYNMLPYDIPVDYLHSPITDKSLSHIHCLKNVQWIWGEKFRKILKLREILLSPDKNRKSRLFSSILKDKIKVKTYLTDRVQTGEHKTDREKRWEVHPESVHFAFRRDCIEIEYRLIDQLCHFEGFPSDLFSLLKEEDIMVDGPATTCPVTQNPFSFVEFEKEIESRVHGKSNFQVGHLNPLKLSSVGLASGHTPQNISWLSADGNRIQGDLSLKETRELLERIHRNYVDQGIIT